MDGDIDQQILTELQKLNRTSRLGLWTGYFAIAILVFSMLLLTFLRIHRRTEIEAAAVEPVKASDVAKEPQLTPDPWDQIRTALDHGQNQRALLLAQDYSRRLPNYHYAQATLGAVYVALNDMPSAEIAYARAVALYADDENEKSLRAVRRKLAGETKWPKDTPK